MADIILYPAEQHNLTIYQGTDLEYPVIIRTSVTDNTPLTITGWTFVARFYRTIGSTVLSSSSAANNTSAIPGQVIVTLSDGDLGEYDITTVGAWDLIGTDTNGLKHAIIPKSNFNVTNDPAT